MSKFNDAGGNASKRRVAQAGERSADRLETETRAVAKKIAHHGPANLIETMRQRSNVNLAPDWAEQLCREYGWTGSRALGGMGKRARNEL